MAMTLRLPAELHEALRLVSERNHRSIHAEIVYRLEVSLQGAAGPGSAPRLPASPALAQRSEVVPSPPESVAARVRPRRDDGECTAYTPRGTRCKLCGKVHK